MSTAINAFVQLDTTSCCVCGVIFAMPKAMLDKRYNDGGNFYCPSGHVLRYTKSEVERLTERLSRSQTRARHLSDQLDAADRSNRALRGVVTKTKKRIAAGVCPCCHRTFQQLSRHMKGQHPDYAESGVS